MGLGMPSSYTDGVVRGPQTLPPSRYEVPDRVAGGWIIEQALAFHLTIITIFSHSLLSNYSTLSDPFWNPVAVILSLQIVIIPLTLSDKNHKYFPLVYTNESSLH